MRSRPELDFVRLASALAIVNYHTAKLAVPVLGSFARLGFVFNTLFMLLSGFLLALAPTEGRTPSPGAFFARRLVRIFPPYHVALVAIAALHLLAGRSVDPASFARSLTGLQVFLGDTRLGPHLWFVGVILVCYAAFLPTLWLVRRLGWAVPTALAAAFVTLYALREGTLADVYARISADLVYRTAYHYLAFVTGLTLGARRGSLALAGGWTALGALVGLFGAYQLVYARPQLGLVTTLVAFGLALALVPVLSAAHAGLFARRRGVATLSGLAYEIYLVHYAVIDALDTVLHGRLWAWPLVFAGTLAVAWLVSRASRGYARLLERLASGGRP